MKSANPTQTEVPETEQTVDLKMGFCHVRSVGAGSQKILLLHATGLNGGSLVPLARSLVLLRPDCSVILPDQRGHGLSSAPKDEDAYDWRLMVGDMAELVDVLGLPTPFAIAGHSMGGVVGLLLAQRLAGRVGWLALLEPALAPATDDETMRTQVEGMVSMTLRRRDRWDTREEAGSFFAKRSPYDSWAGDARELFLHDGLEEHVDGCFRLACRPEHEAATFRAGAYSSLTWSLPAETVVPALGVAGETSGMGDGIKDFTSRFPHGTFVMLPGTSHFLPQEHPAEVAALLNDFLKQAPTTV